MKHVIHFYGPVTPLSFQEFRNVVLSALNDPNNKASEITILISSEGGDLNSGFTAYNFIQNLPLPVTCINMGTVESIAVLMYLAADTRLAVEHSRFLLHSFHWGFNAGAVDQNRLAEHAYSLSYDQERYSLIFDGRTNFTQDTFNIRDCLNGNSKILNRNEAFQFGIITSATTTESIISANDIHWWPRVV